MLDYVRPALAQHGLTISQLTEEYELITLLMHTSGEWLSSRYPLRPVKDDPQGLGSAITYARRYSLLAMLGLAGDDDDDGNAASGLAAPTATQRPPAKTPPPAKAPAPAAATPPTESATATKGAPAAKANGNGNGAKAAPNGNGHKDTVGEYIIQIGTTHKGTSVKDLPLKALVWFANDMAATNPLAQETKDACTAYLKAHPELQVPAPA